MEEDFWERKGVKTAFVWIALDVIVMVLFAFDGFSLDFIRESWLLLSLAVINIDRIVTPLANLPEPPKLFTFLTGIIPAGMLIACFVSMRALPSEEQLMPIILLLISLLLWDAANIGMGVRMKKKKPE